MINQYIFLLYVLVFGFNVLLCFRTGLSQSYLYLLSFPFGLILWSLIILLLLLFGIPPLKPVVLSMDALVLVSIILVNMKKKRYFHLGLKSIGATLFLFSLVSYCFMTFNYSILSNDSWLLIIGGNSISSPGGIPDILLASNGIISYIILSSSSIFGFVYPYALFPLLMLSMFLIFFYGLYSANGEINIRFNDQFFFSSLAVIFMGSGFFIFFNTFYIISNVLAAAFSFFALFGLYKRLQTGVWFWSVFSGLMLIGFSLSRLETYVFVLITVVIFIAQEEIPKREKIFFVLAVVGFCLLWLFRLGFNFSDYDFREMRSGYNFTIISFLIILYLCVLIYGFIHHKRPFKYINSYLPHLMMLGLTGAWSYLLFTKGLFVRGSVLMIFKKYGDLFINIIKDGKWGITWIGLAVLFAVVIWLKKIKYESIFLCYIISFLLLFNSTNLFRFGWRRGWGDSGNRMLLHVVFIVGFYVFLKMSVVFFQGKERSET